MEVHVGIYIRANTIYLGPELHTVYICLGARAVRFSLFGKRVVTTPFVECHFQSLPWP